MPSSRESSIPMSKREIAQEPSVYISFRPEYSLPVETEPSRQIRRSRIIHNFSRHTGPVVA